MMPTENLHTTNAQARILLQPVAAPSILGLYGLAGATFMVAAHMAGWYGSPGTPLYLFPFAAMFGGLAQFLAGMWAYKARDGIATAVHGTWGAFWMAYGILNLMVATGRLAVPVGAFAELGYWFIVLAAISWVSTWAASAESTGLATVTGFLAAGSTTAAIGELAGMGWLITLTGYLFIIAAIAAWYTGTGLLLEDAFGREVWKLGTSRQLREMPPVVAGIGEPGVVHGQAYVRV
jgi:succinate-acetate transporter protein